MLKGNLHVRRYSMTIVLATLALAATIWFVSTSNDVTALAGEQGGGGGGGGITCKEVEVVNECPDDSGGGGEGCPIGWQPDPKGVGCIPIMPSPLRGSGEGEPDPLGFEDDGSLAYTSRLDPPQHRTRDNVVVDPASGQLTFRLPLPHSVKGRASDLDIALIYRSNLQFPGGKAGAAGWVPNFWKALVFDTVFTREQCETNIREDILTVINSTQSIIQHDGESGTTIWTNRDAALGDGPFSGMKRGLPAGNLASCARITVPVAPAGPVVNEVDPMLGIPDGPHIPPDTEPKFAGDMSAANTVEYTEFVPPLGNFAAMKIECDAIRIRYADGRIDEFTQFRKVRENGVNLDESNDYPPCGISSPPCGPREDAIRVQFLAAPRKTIFPNGDEFLYYYNQDGYLSSIVDNFGQTAIRFSYEPGTNRITSIKDVLPDGAGGVRETLFEFNSDKILSTVAMPEGKVWKFEYGLDVQLNTDLAALRPEMKDFLIPTTFSAYRPGDPYPADPYLEVLFENFVDPNPDDGVIPEPLSRVVEVTFGGTDTIDHIPGLGSWSVTGGQSVWYNYTEITEVDGCDGGQVTITDSNGLTRIHVFDWMSREISRIDKDMGPDDAQGNPTDLTTTFEYTNQYPLITRTNHPKGNWVEQRYEFQDGDADGFSYFANPQDPGEISRDPFSGANIITRTQGGDPSGTLVDSYEYEPYLNQVRKHTNPRGHTTEHIFDYQENANTDMTAFLMSWFINADDIIGEAWNLGETNGDTTTTQIFGNRIATIYPTVDGDYTADVNGGPQVAIELAQYESDRGMLIKEIDAEGYVTTYEYYDGDDPDGDGNEIPDADPNLPGYLKKIVVDAESVNGSTPLQITTEYGYDKAGRTIWETNPRNANWHTFTKYDLVNRVTRTVTGDVDSTGTPNSGSALYIETFKDYDLDDRVIETREYNDDPALAGAGDNPGYVTTYFGYDMYDDVRVIASELIEPSPTGPVDQGLLTYFYHYDGNSKPIKEVSPEGRAISYVHDELGRVTKKTRHLTEDPAPSDPTSIPAPNAGDAVTHYDYDANSNMVEVNVERTVNIQGDPATSDYFMTYDGFDRRTQLDGPEGISSIHTFDKNSNLIRVENVGPRDHLDTATAVLAAKDFAYDARDRLAEIDVEYFRWEPNGSGGYNRIDLGTGGSGHSILEFAYDARSMVVAKRNDQGHVTNHVYDGAGRKTVTELPTIAGTSLRNKTETTYDANGNVRFAKSYEVGHDGSDWVTEVFTTESRYDELGRVKRTLQEPGVDQIVTNFQHSSLGHPIRTLAPPSAAAPTGIGTRAYFDTQGRQVATEYGYDHTFTNTTGLVVGPNNADGFIRTEVEYDADGNVLVQRDDEGNETTTEYDAIGRKERLIYADLTDELLAYTKEGTLASETMRDETEGLLYDVAYSYDLANRKTAASFNLASTAISLKGVELETFDYDGLGRVTQATMIAFDAWDPTIEYASTVQKQYDSMDFVREDYQELAITDTSTTVISDTVSCEFDSLGRRTDVSTSSGYDRDYVFDSLGRITSIDDPTFGATPEHTFEYLGPGSRLRVQQNVNGTETRIGMSGYDKFRRLTTLEHRDTSGLQTGFEYSYDKAGNQLDELKLHTTAYADSKKFDYDAANRMKTYSTGTPSTWTAAEHFGLDGVGNWLDRDGNGTVDNTVNEMNEYVTDFDSTSVQYDARGNLDQYGSDEYVYDARGRIVGAKVGTTEYSYVFDAQGRRVFGEGWFYTHENIREIRQDNGTDSVDFTFATGIDEVVSFVKDDGTTVEMFTLQRNRIGSTMALTGEAGAVVERYDYSPFGVPTTTVDGGVDSPLLFAGRRNDKGTGLYFMRARSYLAEMGRFVSRDSIGIWGDAYNSGNTYAYCFSNPWAGCDPSGNSIELKIWKFLDDTFGLNNVERGLGYFAGGVNTVTGGASDAITRAAAPEVFAEAHTGHFADGHATGERHAETAELVTGVKGVATAGVKAIVRNADDVAEKLGRIGIQSSDDVGEAAARKIDDAATSGGAGPVDQGRAGVTQSRADAVARGEAVRGGEVTVELPSGKRSRVDTVTEADDGTRTFIESKNGPNARLTPNQRELRDTLNSGGNVTPRGGRAEQAGLTPGQPVGGKFREDRFDPPVGKD